MPRNVVIAFASATSGAVLTTMFISREQKSAKLDRAKRIPVKHLSTFDLSCIATDERFAAARRREAEDEYNKRGWGKYGFYKKPRSSNRA